MSVQLSLDQRIEATPGVCGGRSRIAGHRIRVQDIVTWHDVQGLSADEMVAGYPQRTHTDVYAALACYHAHRDDILFQMREDEDFAEQFRQNPGQAAGRDADGNPFPS